MKLTSEQAEVINYAKQAYKPENIALIALAGAGKTSTLKEIAKAMPDKNILYIVFSKDMQKDSEKKFPKNTKVSTVNALAYNCMEIKAQPMNKYDPYTVANILRCDTQTAKIVIQELSNFCNSQSNQINNAYSNLAKEFWEKICTGKAPYTHDSYMKYFATHLDKFKDKLNYDLLLVDESQDLNPLALQITQNLKMPRIFVGDPNQSIFQFNNNVNVFDTLEFTKKMYLTQTFRCSEDIVRLANDVLRFKDENLQIKTKIPSSMPENKAIITRTNAKIVQILYNYLEDCTLDDLDGIRIPKLTRPVKDIFAAPITIQNLIKFVKDGQEPVIEDINFAWLKKYIVEKQLSESEFRKFCLSAENPEIRQAYLLLVSTYKKQMTLKQLSAALKILQRKHAVMPNMTLLTAHSSKGLEFDSVTVCDDFPNLKSLKTEYNKAFAHANFGRTVEIRETAQTHLGGKEQNFIAESNLYYVAVTRAKFEIEDRSENSEIFFYQQSLNSNIHETKQPTLNMS